MKRLILSFLSLISASGFAAYDSDDWIECTKIHVCAHSPVQNQAVFLNTYTEVGDPENTWNEIDLSDVLPSTAKAVMLSGRLIITQGYTNETSDLHISFRAVGETEDFYRIGQVVETTTGNGIRSGMAVWVPLDENQCFEYKWWRSTVDPYPTHCAYGINLNINAWSE